MPIFSDPKNPKSVIAEARDFISKTRDLTLGTVIRTLEGLPSKDLEGIARFVNQVQSGDPQELKKLSSRMSDLERTQRDALFQKNRASIPANLRTWAAEAPLNVLQAFVTSISNATPTEVRASRNSLSEAMGIRTRAAPTPYREEGGALVVPTATPTEVRARIAARSNGGRK